MRRLAIGVLVGLSCTLVRAESFEALGQRINVTNPAGYCTVGSSPRERELLVTSQRLVGPGARIVHAAYRCSELDAFKAGRRETFDHWLLIQLIGPKGNFKRMEGGREAFLTGITKATPRIDSVEMQRRMRAALDSDAASLSDMQFTPIGRDGNAAYYSMRMTLKDGQVSRVITGLTAITLLNALPLSSNVYEATGRAASREQLQPTLQSLLTSLLTEN